MSLIKHYVFGDCLIFERDYSYNPTATEIDKQTILAITEYEDEAFGAKRLSDGEKNAILSVYPHCSSTGERKDVNPHDLTKYPIIRMVYKPRLPEHMENTSRNAFSYAYYLKYDLLTTILKNEIRTPKLKMCRQITRRSFSETECNYLGVCQGRMIEALVFRGARNTWPVYISWNIQEYGYVIEKNVQEYTFVGIPCLNNITSDIQLIMGRSRNSPNSCRHTPIVVDIITVEVDQLGNGKQWNEGCLSNTRVYSLVNGLDIPARDCIRKNRCDTLVFPTIIWSKNGFTRPVSIDREEQIKELMGDDYQLVRSGGRAVKRAR